MLRTSESYVLSSSVKFRIGYYILVTSRRYSAKAEPYFFTSEHTIGKPFCNSDKTYTLSKKNVRSDLTRWPRSA